MSDEDTPRTHKVVFQPSGRQAEVAQGTTLLDAARTLGVDIDSICGGRQTCGRCKVVVADGSFAKYGIESANSHLSPPDVVERAFLRRIPGGTEPGARLACAACVEGAAVVAVPPESQTRKQVIRKTASERPITVEPTVRQMFVEVERHELGARDGDWERLQDALRREWGLDNLGIDIHALRQLSPALRAGKQQVMVRVWNDREVIDIQPGYHEGVYGLAVDVGSTTIAAHLCDLDSGAVLATASMMNPQVTFGEDLMSRVSYAMLHDDGLGKMQAAVIGGLNRLSGQAASTAGLRARDIYEMVVVGNTVMHHILLGLDPTDLGAAPFTLATHAALDIKARDLSLKLHPAANVHCMALEAGHVGSDNVGVLLAEAPDQQDAITLVIDVGTNAEILLGNRERLLSASSPTGPAFEGAQITHGQRAAPGAIERVRIDAATGEPRFKVIGQEAWSDEQMPAALGATGICGSAIIEVVAELFMAGLVRPDGRFDDIAATPRLHWDGPKAEYVLATADQTATGHPIVVTQDDIRNVQLAKAALYAGCKLLLRRRGVERPDRIVLAGAFGSYIDPTHAMVLGLFPDCDLANVHAVGNAAGDGARIALLNRTRRHEAALAARRVEYVETAIDPFFQEEFVAAIHLPNMTDSFPHLDALGVLPARRQPSADARAERRERRRVRA
jgi:uncharacterized 2Fe-2S/4Fe-4S cluster protein (DUF4445 family)